MPSPFLSAHSLPSAHRNHKLDVYTAPTKAKSRESAYSQVLIQNKIDRQRVRSRESGKQADNQTAMVDGVWSSGEDGGREKRMNQDRTC